MSTDIATTSAYGMQANAAAVAKYVGLDPNDPKSHAVVAICDRYGLDPVLKHVIVLPKGGVYVTRDGALHIAHKSGQLDGIVLEEQGETNAEWYAVVAVYRKDMRHPFRYRGRYPKNGSNRQYGPEMGVKVAERTALMRAFDIADQGGGPEAPEEPQAFGVSTSHLAARLRPAHVDDDGVIDDHDIVGDEGMPVGDPQGELL